MTRETLLRLDRALAEVSDSLSEVPDSEWNEFITLQGQVNEAHELVSNKLDALAAGRYQ